jgi:hypothetical protein
MAAEFIAPYVHEKKSKSGKLAFLSYFAIIIWPVFNQIGQWFDWDDADPIDDTDQDDKSPFIFMGEEYVEVENVPSTVPISTLEDFKIQFQQFGKDMQEKVEHFGKDIQEKFEGKIEEIFHTYLYTKHVGRGKLEQENRFVRKLLP